MESASQNKTLGEATNHNRLGKGVNGLRLQLLLVNRCLRPKYLKRENIMQQPKYAEGDIESQVEFPRSTYDQ
jgi:hypothetical protein